MITWSETSAYWIFSQLNNWAYTRYNMIHPEIEKSQQKLELQFAGMVRDADQTATVLMSKDADAAVEFLTAFSEKTGNQLVADWKLLYHYLFMKYQDGNLKIS